MAETPVRFNAKSVRGTDKGIEITCRTKVDAQQAYLEVIADGCSAEIDGDKVILIYQAPQDTNT